MLLKKIKTPCETFYLLIFPNFYQTEAFMNYLSCFPRQISCNNFENDLKKIQIWTYRFLVNILLPYINLYFMDPDGEL